MPALILQTLLLGIMCIHRLLDKLYPTSSRSKTKEAPRHFTAIGEKTVLFVDGIFVSPDPSRSAVSTEKQIHPCDPTGILGKDKR